MSVNKIHYNNKVYTETFEITEFERDKCLGALKLSHDAMKSKIYSFGVRISKSTQSFINSNTESGGMIEVSDKFINTYENLKHIEIDLSKRSYRIS